jgi:CxxC motif-containing protein (DUF1111 family)
MSGRRAAANLGGMLVWLGLSLAAGQGIGGGSARADSKAVKPDPVAVGAEIFNREWVAADPRSHGGDGLGPVYNDSSCVACHNAGGSGGAGPISKNIDILSASLNLGMNVSKVAPGSGPEEAAGSSSSTAAPGEALANFHADFRTGRTVVLHKFGSDPNYDAWRSRALRAPAASPVTNLFFGSTPAPAAELPADIDDATTAGKRRGVEDSASARAEARIQQIREAVLERSAASRQSMAVGQFLVARSQRNPSALFGLGLIDAIPAAAIEAMPQKEARESPMTQGRVSRVKDGRIGRLGWKGQIASVEDFVLNACAVELGLEVPGHHQSVTPQAPKYRATGQDLTAEECAALVAYVRSLPRPAEQRPEGVAAARRLGGGKAAFARIGCADCHAPKLGDVEGIYSDLLLHDMGQEIADDGFYSSGSDGSDEGSEEPLVPEAAGKAAEGQPVPSPAARGARGASRQEWRTPPLWGFRDSGPYLHDGRAQTLEEAVAMHGGQGTGAAQAFFRLSPKERQEVESFLKSLVAPSVQVARRGD